MAFDLDNVRAFLAAIDHGSFSAAARALGRVPSAVSMSERQRAALARAVVTEPFLLLADEPAAHLDAAGAGEIATLLEQEHLRGMTVLITTHDPAYADRFRDAQRITL